MWIIVGVVVVLILLVLGCAVYNCCTDVCDSKIVAIWSPEVPDTEQDMEVIEYAAQELCYDIPVVAVCSDDYLSTLKRLYRQGKRIFIGLSSSVMLNDVKCWFESHCDVVGLSTFSNGEFVNPHPNIYRMLVPSDVISDKIAALVNGMNYGRVVYVQDKKDEFGDESYNALKTKIPDLQRQSVSNLSELKLQNSDLVINGFVDNASQFYEYTMKSGLKYKIVDSVGASTVNPVVINNPKFFSSRFYHVGQVSGDSTLMQEVEYNTGIPIGVSVAWDATVLAIYLDKHGVRCSDIESIPTSSGYISFDENMDRELNDVEAFNYSRGSWNVV